MKKKQFHVFLSFTQIVACNNKYCPKINYKYDQNSEEYWLIINTFQAFI